MTGNGDRGGIDRAGWLIIANPAAGSAARKAVGAAAGVLAGRGPVEIRWTTTPDEVDDALAEAGDRLPVVAGGDGSLHTVVNRLARGRAANGATVGPIGLIPLGTGNDTARHARIPLDPEAAAQVVLDGGPVARSALVLPDGRLGVNNLHTGVGLVAAERGTAWKPRLHRFAYPAAAVVEGLRHDGTPLTVHADGTEVFDGSTFAVLVLAGPSVGGGFEPVDGVEGAAPHLDLVIVETMTPPRRLALGARASLGRLAGASGVHHRPCREVTLSAWAGAPIRFDVDGEIDKCASPLTVRIAPAAWQIIGPRSTPPGDGS